MEAQPDKSQFSPGTHRVNSLSENTLFHLTFLFPVIGILDLKEK